MDIFIDKATQVAVKHKKKNLNLTYKRKANKNSIEV